MTGGTYRVGIEVSLTGDAPFEAACALLAQVHDLDRDVEMAATVDAHRFRFWSTVSAVTGPVAIEAATVSLDLAVHMLAEPDIAAAIGGWMTARRLEQMAA